MSNTSNNKTANSKPTKSKDKDKLRVIVGEIGRDSKTGILGRGYSSDNGKTFHVTDTMYGRLYDPNDIEGIWNGGTADKVKKEVDSATAEIPAAVSAANSAVSAAESVVAASKVNSDAIVAQSEAISEAKSAIDSATAEIQQTAANAASDAAKIRADVAQVQNEVDTAKAANSASVEALKSDVSAAKQDLADVHDSLTKAQAAAEESQKAIDKSIAQINSDIEQDRKDIAGAQQTNADTAKQLDTYSKQAQDQGKTIKSIQDKQDGFTATLADVQGNVTQVSDKVDGLSASLKDAQGNVASVKAQADQLSATLTDHAKSIATLTASAKELSSTLEDADGRLSKVEQTAQMNSSTLSDLQGDLSQVKQDATTLTATLKDEQGNISTLQQKADSVSTQLASAQGDIATLQTGVDGVKATLASHDKTIHTLQLDSKSLKDSMADAQGDISTLNKTATDLDSEMKDHAGRLSKVEQSAATQAITLSDLQGNLTQVKQQADGLVTTLKDAQGSITQIQQKADGTLEQLKSAQGDIASLQTDVTGIKATLISHEGDIHTLQADSKTLKDDMQDAQGNISSLQKSSTKLDSEMSSQDGRLSKVEQTAKEHTTTISDLGDKFNNMKVGGRNLLHGTSDQWRTLTGSGWLSSSTASDVYTSVADYHDGDQFTYSAIITNPSAVPVRLVLYCYGTNKQEKIKTVLGQPVKPGAGAKAVSVTITTDWRTWFLRSNIETVDGEAPQISIQAKEEKLEAGNTATAWSPNPEDIITSISKNSTAIDQTNQQISLKADQTEVDQIKNTASQNSSRLDVMAGEIKSKVTSTDVNNIVDKKGYATTSTVQSLITQKAGTINESITNLTSKFNSLQIGGTNVLKGTDPDSLSDTFSDHKWKVDSGGNGHGALLDLGSEFSAKHGFKIFGNTGGNKDFTQQPMHWNGGEYVFTVYIRLPPEAEQASVTALIRAWNNTKGRASYQNAIAITSKEWHKFSMKIDSSSFYEDDCGLSFGLTGVGSLDFAEPMLVTGSVASDWTPAPSDNATVTQVQQITASIDGLQSTVANKADKSQITQLSNVIQSKVSSSDFNDLKDKTTWKSADSIDLNTAVSQQKIFVKGGSNLPPGSYWWYVRVEPGYASRIAQYATSDRDNKQYHRQYDGVNWSAWTQDASESEITQLRDDINLRVKSGDLISQLNLEAGRALIQSNKIYLDADSVIMGPNTRAFIPSAAIVNLDVAKLNAGTINTDRIHIGDDSVYLSVKNNYLRLDGSNTKDKYQLRLTGNNIEFADNDSSNWEYRIQHGINKYQTDEDGLDFDVYSKRGGANHTVMAVSDAGVMISPSLFFQTNGIDSSNWMGFTRNTVDGNSSVSFHTWDDNNEGFHVDCGARFMNYVYINGYARAQGWLTNSTLSKKTNIRKLDLQTALDKIRQDDQYLYEYKRNVAKGIHDPQASFIIDDIHDVAQYSVPREFIDQSGEYREPNVELAYLVAAFQALDKQVQSQQAEIKKLKEQLNND